MRVLPYVAIFTFVAGLSLLVAGFAFSSDVAPEPESPGIAFDLRTAIPDTPTTVPTDVPTATPTPLPFDGAVARMIAPAVGIDNAIEEIGITNNQLDTPKDAVNKVGWYYIYDKPGFGGNALFSAHVYYHSIPAPFVSLAKSAEGDKIVVQMENGTEYTYSVISNKRYNRDTIDMGAIIWPKEKADYDEWITLITCGGELDSTGQEYVSRDVIVAKRIS